MREFGYFRAVTAAVRHPRPPVAAIPRPRAWRRSVRAKTGGDWEQSWENDSGQTQKTTV